MNVVGTAYRASNRTTRCVNNMQAAIGGNSHAENGILAGLFAACTGPRMGGSETNGRDTATTPGSTTSRGTCK